MARLYAQRSEMNAIQLALWDASDHNGQPFYGKAVRGSRVHVGRMRLFMPSDGLEGATGPTTGCAHTYAVASQYPPDWAIMRGRN